jgi:hypothetical protein
MLDFIGNLKKVFALCQLGWIRNSGFLYVLHTETFHIGCIVARYSPLLEVLSYPKTSGG